MDDLKPCPLCDNNKVSPRDFKPGEAPFMISCCCGILFVSDPGKLPDNSQPELYNNHKKLTIEKWNNRKL